MPVRVTLLLAVTTNPSDLSSASPHSGGWSESFYINGSVFMSLAQFTTWGNSRATLLPAECSVQGYRQQLVTINGNRLLPGGSASGVLNIPGSSPNDLNAPQDALMINFQVNTQPNSIRHRLASVPDSQVTNGEYQPSAAYKGLVTKYINLCTGQLTPLIAFAAITRDLTQPEARVKSMTGGVVTTLSATGCAAGDYLILRRVRDNNNDPIEGSYLVTLVTPNADGSFSYTLYNAPAQTTAKPNGTARKDVLVINPLVTGNPNRLVVRKVGRPFVQYRGRRSKRPA